MNRSSRRTRALALFLACCASATAIADEVPTAKQLIDGAKADDLPITFTSAVTDHEASDAAGDLLGAEENSFWRDHKSSKVNAIRIKTHLENCDIAIIRFGEKFKQWNAAFDAGYCAAKGKPYITLHDEDIVHALKEVDAAAMA